MNAATDRVALGEGRPHRRVGGRVLIGSGVLFAVGAGLLMWAHQGPAVFGQLVLSTIAWCF